MSASCEKLAGPMRLELFSVRNFRSINRAVKLPLGEFTVLLGPNNEGKSNILQAMVLGMRELSTLQRPGAPRRIVGSRLAPGGFRRGRATGGYAWERDFPRGLQDAEPDGKTVMHFDFLLTDEEVGEFYTEVGSRLNGALPITLTFGRTGAPVFGVRKPRHAKALAAKRAQISEFVARRVQVQYVDAVRTGQSVTQVVTDLVSRELSQAAADNPAYAEALTRLREVQQPVFDFVSASITEIVRSLLPDVASVRLAQRSEGSHVQDAGRIDVIVDDGTATDLTLKGDGVQSLAALAMTQHYSRETARAREFILAVEEPEAHLHPRAIHGLRDTLRDTASKQQVIITTHSPLFANRLELQSNIIVRRNRATPARTVQELRDALGVQTSDNLTSAEVVVVVEGRCDALIVQSILADRSALLGRALRDGVVTLIPLYGGGKLSYLLAQLRDSLSAVHAFVDNDEQGRQALATASDEGLLEMRDSTVATCPGASESEIEDLIRVDTYSQLFFDRFGVDTGHPWTERLSKGKWSRRMPKVFEGSGKLWTDEISMAAKEAVAHAVASSPSDAVKPSCEGVWVAMVALLEERLRQRSR